MTFKILKKTSSTIWAWRKMILILMFFLTYMFTIWQLDLIRDQFIQQGIYYESIHSPDPFNDAMWKAQFGFPPFCWFGWFFPLQTSFDLMYFLQAAIVFVSLVWLSYEILERYFPEALKSLEKKKVNYRVFINTVKKR